MINIIVPVVENVEEFATFVKEKAKGNTKFFVGIKESLKDKFSIKSKNVEIHIFDDKSKKEEIVNSLHSCKMERGKVLIARRPLTDDEFEKLTTSNKDICTLKAEHNGFVSFVKNLAKKIVRKCFGFSYFEDISAICYNENMFELFVVCKNLSIASRINKYVGIEHEEFVTTEKPVKREYNRTTNILTLMLWIILFAGSLIGAIFIGIYTTMHVLTVVLLIAWIFVVLVLMLVGIVNFTRTVAVGTLHYGRAEEK